MLPKIRHEIAMVNLYKRVSQDHEYCDFRTDIQSAPRFDQQRDISRDGKYRFINGATSITMMQGKHAVVRWFVPQHLVKVDGYTDNGSRINRLWSEYEWPVHIMEKSNNRNIILPPKYSEPGFYTNMSQIDIRSCYYTIMCLVGLYPIAKWGKAFGVWHSLDGVYPFPEIKSVRNAMYGMCFNPRQMFATRGNFKYRIPDPKIINPHLHQTIQCIMHSIARKAVGLGAVQWHTDGGCLPTDKAYMFCQWIGDNYGLSTRIICSGDCMVNRPDHYYTSSHIPKAPSKTQLATNTIDGWKGDYNLAQYEDWLIGKLKPWVKRRMKPDIEIQ